MDTPSKRDEVFIRPPVSPTTTRDSRDSSRSSDASTRIHGFYYAWYGNPTVNGKYLHWDHEVRLCSGLSSDERKVLEKGGGRHKPPHDIGAAFYPKLGLYSSIDRNVIRSHMEMLVSAKIGVIVVSWYDVHS